MYAEAFEFNGIKSDDLGFYIMNFDGFSNDGVGSAGTEITFTTSKPSSSDRLNYTGSKTENPLQFNFQIGKMHCAKSDPYLSREECAFITRWLERHDGYRWLRLLQKEYEHTYFHCKIHIEWIRVQGKIIGAELSITCDSPYGYSKIKSYETELNDGESFQIYNDSDHFGDSEIEEIEIAIKEITGNGTITIKNNLDKLYAPTIEHVTTIDNCIAGEAISIANHQINANSESHHTHQSITEDFNFQYPRLINLSDSADYDISNEYPTYDENRINEFALSGANCNIHFTYRTIRSVMP